MSEICLISGPFRAADHRPKSAPLSKNRRLEYIKDFLVLNESVISEVYPNDFYKFCISGLRVVTYLTYHLHIFLYLMRICSTGCKEKFKLLINVILTNC